MSYSAYLTKVSITGTKSAVIRMLNAAIQNAGDGIAITTEDSIEAINAKFYFKDDNGYEKWLRLYIHSFLDMDSIGSAEMKQRQKAFMDEWAAPSDNDVAIIVKAVKDMGDKYEVELHLGEEEYEYLRDWATWADLAETYGVRIFVDVYDYGTHPGFLGTTIHEWVDGSVEITKIDPSIHLGSFYKDFSTLIELYPERYRAVMIETLENEIEQLQELILETKLSLAKGNVKKSGDRSENTNVEDMKCEKDLGKEDETWIKDIFG